MNGDKNSIIGAVVYRVAKAQFESVINEDESDGAFFVLKQFSPEILCGFISSAEDDKATYSKLVIQFPRSTMRNVVVDSKYLVEESAVNIRNAYHASKVVFTNDLEPDVKESLSHKSGIGHEDVMSSKNAHIWAEVLDEVTKASFSESYIQEIEAFIRAILSQGDISLPMICQYFLEVVEACKNEPIVRAAGRSLPLLGVPLYSSCFSAVKNTRHTSEWQKALERHRQNESLLSKRWPKTMDLLDNTDLQKALDEQYGLEQGDAKRLKDETLSQFSDYIQADARGSETEAFLFENDWSDIEELFGKEKKTSASDFVSDTREALEHDGVTIDDTIEEILNDLKNKRRQSGKAPESIKEFYSKYRANIQEYIKPRLAQDWEDYVVGSKVSCSDFFEGLMQCVRRCHKALSESKSVCLQIACLRQRKINDFKGLDKGDCIYFEKRYGALAEFLPDAIEFSKKESEKSLLFNYSESVLPHLPKDKTKKSSNAQKNNKAFEFRVSIKEKGETGATLASVNLNWKCPSKTVLRKEQEDLETILKAKGGTLVFCDGAYESIGDKGTPKPLDLSDTKSFNGAKGAGNFIPALTKIKTIPAAVAASLEQEQQQGNISAEEVGEIQDVLQNFELKYTTALSGYTQCRTDVEAIEPMLSAYAELLCACNSIQAARIKKICLKLILKIGVVEVEEDSGRPSAVVVCPWHPIRMEAWRGRVIQIKESFNALFAHDSVEFSDGQTGALFFDDFKETVTGVLAPEAGLYWKNMEPRSAFCSDYLGGYSVHTPLDIVGLRNPIENSKSDLNEIVKAIQDYISLQPHERDNLSIIIYNCGSQVLPSELRKKLEEQNAELERKGDAPMNCEIILTHKHQTNLHDVYKSLIATHGMDSEQEGSDDFLSKVRINISASQDFSHRSPKRRTPPVDLVFCKDLLSSNAKLSWTRVAKKTFEEEEIFTHRWNRGVPNLPGDDSSKILLCTPAQTDAGWKFLLTLAGLCEPDYPCEWDGASCLLPAKVVNYDDFDISESLLKCHDLGVWIVNSDEMLDRQSLESRGIRVIRYIQSLFHGRNLVISSKASDLLLRTSLRERLLDLVPTMGEESLEKLCNSFIKEANTITGGLVLRAARRANNTAELLGVVLSKFLIRSEIGGERPACWCSLDDYYRWLGKPNGDHLADLLILCPNYRDGEPHLDIIVSEAKFVVREQLGSHKERSKKQLKDTLNLISRALSTDGPLDQELWLSRLSDLLLSRLKGVNGRDSYAPEKWRDFVRDRKCTFSIKGYSHIFVQDDDSHPSSCPGIDLGSKHSMDVIAQQEIFNSSDTRDFIKYVEREDYLKIQERRMQTGTTGFDDLRARKLSKPERNTYPSEISKAPAGHTEEVAEVSEGLEPQPPEEVTQETSGPQSSETKISSNDELANDPIALLYELRSKVSKDDSSGDWLNTTVNELKNALRARGLSSRLFESQPPILTPNAALITFQGDPDLTQKKIEDSAPEFLTTYGINILRVVPGRGCISVHVERPRRQIIHTVDVFHQFLTSPSFKVDSEAIAVGLREEDGQLQLLDPYTEPHTLVSGATNSGKSVLIQCMLLYIALTRKPSETQIFLVDGKYGVDYSALRNLPHLKAGSGSIVVKKEESMELLEQMVAEMERRYQLFEQSGSKDIRSYRKITGEELPTLFYVQDEFADWMLDEEYARAISRSVNSLSIKSRAAGIFMVFGLQRPDNTVMPLQLRSQLSNRLTLKVADKGTAEIATGEKNSAAERLLGRGHMLAKLEGKLIPIQVPYTDPIDDLTPLVNCLAQKFKQPS